MRNAILMLLNVARVLLDVLQEIFDAAAYARFLDRTKRASSREAYSAFCRDRDAGRERRPRCC